MIKKAAALLLFLALLPLASEPSYGQCTGVFGAGTACGNNGSASALPSAARTIALGANGTAAGILKLRGSATGEVTLQPGGTGAGTYNFNLPTSAGSSGQPLLSGGGGSTAMSFGTLGLAGGGTGGTDASSARSGLGLGTMATQAASAVAITGGSITGMSNPSGPTDVANKQYVDSVATGLIVHTPAKYATAAVLPQTPTYSNGASGVGATLTAASNAALVVDGTSVSSSDRILVKNQASALQNGVYSVTTVGSGGSAWVLTRVTDFDTAGEMTAGSYFLVTAGSTNASTSWALQTAVTTVGTDAVNFAQFSASSTGVTSATIAAGTGISVSGTCTITSTGTCTVSLNGNINNATRADLNGVDEVIASEVYTIFSAAHVVFNQGSYYDGATLRLTPPTGARAVHLYGSLWISAGADIAGGDNYVAKWIKNWTIGGGGQLTSGTDVCAGVGSIANATIGQATIQASCYDVPSASDYYALFIFVKGNGGGNVTIDGNAAHSFISMNVMRF